MVAQFLHCDSVLLVVRSLAVPADLVLHEGNALALNGLLNDHCGLVENSLSLVERSLDLVEVVTVDADNVPAESLELLVDGVRRHNLGYLAVDLETVVINDCNQIIKLIVSREHCSLPYLTLLDLAISEHSEMS